MTPQAKDRAYWAEVHINGDKAPPVYLPMLRHRRRIGSGVRMERGKLIEV